MADSSNNNSTCQCLQQRDNAVTQPARGPGCTFSYLWDMSELWAAQQLCFFIAAAQHEIFCSSESVFGGIMLEMC